MTRYLVANLAYGWGSWGDEMILDGVLNRLGRQNCIVFSHDPEETEQMHGVQAITHNQYCRGDIVYVGGSGWGYPAMARNVAAVVGGFRGIKPVVVEAAGLRQETNWTELAPAFRDVERFTVRDPLSQEIVRQHLGREAEIVPDFSAYMGVEPVELPSCRWVGVNVKNDPAAMLRLVPLFREILRRGYRLVALPTIAHKEDSSLDGHQACRRLGQMLGSQILDLPGPWNKRSLHPRQLAGVAQRCSFVVGMRKHGCWVAARSGVPVLMCDWWADHGLPYRLRQLREVIPNSRYCDLLAGEDPLGAISPWLDSMNERRVAGG